MGDGGPSFIKFLPQRQNDPSSGFLLGRGQQLLKKRYQLCVLVLR